MPLPNEGGEEDKIEETEEIMPDSKPPEVPGEGNYIDALNEAGVAKVVVHRVAGLYDRILWA